MTDHQVFEKFKHFGKQALEARNKCIGLLPEIYRRQLFRQHGFASIHEFAAKLAGISHEQVNRVLNLEKRLQDKPDLHRALISGMISVNKLRKVISITTVENQAEVAKTIGNLSVRAVETLVRDHKIAVSAREDGTGHVTTQKDMFSDMLQLEPELERQLLEMQRKGLNINKLFKEFLKQYQAGIEAEKNNLADELHNRKAHRYLPARVKKLLRREYGTKCSVPDCRREAAVFHHTRRFTLVSSHDPRFIAPLCKWHHELAHQVDTKVWLHRRQGALAGTSTRPSEIKAHH